VVRRSVSWIGRWISYFSGLFLFDAGTPHSKKKNQINGLSPPLQVKKEIHEMFENEYILR